MQPDVTVEHHPLSDARDDAVVLLLGKEGSARRAVASLGKGHAEAHDVLRERKVFAGDDGQVRALHGGRKAVTPTLVLSGVGASAKAGAETLRRAAAAGVRAAREQGARTVTLAFADVRRLGVRPAEAAAAAVEGALLGLYRFEAWKSEKSKVDVSRLTVLVPKAERKAAAARVEEARVVAEAVATCRDLGNEPCSTCTPSWLAARAEELAKEHGLGVEILEEDDMRRLGMGSLLGVTKGSHEPAKIIVLTHEPKGKGRPDTVALVGKGITFDSGGISIKPAAKMEDMKFDMCGGAAVIAATVAAARLRVPVRVVGIVPACENLPGGGSYKPGDVLKAMNGVTIEVKNTDAEGRLILADALAYATGRMKPRPKAVVDVATLTGACVVALGDQCAGLVANDDRLAERIERAADEAGDPVWRMPLKPGYRKQMESTVADLSNLGGPGAGALTAAAFLERFTGEVPWAHLDIAGVAWTEKEDGYRKTGATGFGVRALLRLLSGWSRR
jgi:leucyl aminopeptidase